jgi:hypothetical protein
MDMQGAVGRTVGPLNWINSDEAEKGRKRRKRRKTMTTTVRIIAALILVTLFTTIYLKYTLFFRVTEWPDDDHSA